MHIPLDLGGLEILIAVGILLSGTVVFCVLLAATARGIDRAWDLVGRTAVPSGGAAMRRRPEPIRISRTTAGGTIAAAVLGVLTWLTVVAGRLQQLG
jgi:hypothetical protein